MFTWVGSQLDRVLDAYALSVVSALMTAMTPVALSLATLWVALYGWAVLRNEVADTVPSFVWKTFKIGMVLAVALQSGTYTAGVSDTANGLGNGVAATFLPSNASPMASTSPYALLDEFDEKANQLVVDLWREAGVTRLDLAFAAVVTAIGNVIFLCIALFVVTLSRVFLTFTIAIGPLFVLCLAWRPSARFFDSWLSMLLNAIVLTWFSLFSLGLSAFIGSTLVQAIQDEGGLHGPAFNGVAESLRYCVVMLLMAVVCFQAPSLASALTGGVAIQQGLQMIQNARIVSRVRNSGSRGQSTVFNTGANVRAAAGIPFAVGRGLGGAAASIHRGASTARTAAYRLAAQRGRG